MKDKMTYVMLGNVVVAVMLTSGCQSLSKGRTVFGGKVDPYNGGSAPVVKVETSDVVKPVEVAGDPLPKAEVVAQPTQTQPWQEFIVPEGYVDPTAGLQRVTSKKVLTLTEEDINKTESKSEVVDGFINYTVKAGDSLSVIANSNGVKTAELAEINGIAKADYNKIRVGQKLKIPAGRTPFVSGAKATTSVDKNVHVVAAGEALSLIAKKYGVKTADLVKENSLKNANSIYVGQKLKIPSNKTVVATPKAVEKKPEVKKVETKKVEAPKAVTPAVKTPTVAPKANDEINIDMLLDNSPTAPSNVGTEADVPVLIDTPAVDSANIDIDNLLNPGAAVTAKTVDDQLNSLANGNVSTISVMKGDDIHSISARYGITVDTFLKLNGFSSDVKLEEGQVVKIPSFD